MSHEGSHLVYQTGIPMLENYSVNVCFNEVLQYEAVTFSSGLGGTSNKWRIFTWTTIEDLADPTYMTIKPV